MQPGVKSNHLIQEITFACSIGERPENVDKQQITTQQKHRITANVHATNLLVFTRFSCPGSTLQVFFNLT